MTNNLVVYNSLTRNKEEFQPITEGFVGMYVCGPTVYSDVHLGNCRTFVSFDVIYRFLKYLGYKVRYVRNITDVGHLLDDGEDRISKGARLMALEPMEVVQKYTLGFHEIMRILNTLPPSIEPRATGHIVEQIEMVKDIIKNGYAYEKNGSVYFDTEKFMQKNDFYGQLSGRKVDELLSETRDNLKNQSEKKNPTDFAIWMKASDEHLMKWPSPWSEGFPGWHLECSAMSMKYLGAHFDIHGGGNDLKFPHHENEIAQNFGACGCKTANYWFHTNMLLMNGRKMSKSDGNTITPYQLFTGESKNITEDYPPMVVKFFMLQSHYRSTLDMSDDALKAAKKGYHRLIEAYESLNDIEVKGSNPDTKLAIELRALIQGIHDEMLDDFNSPKSLARMFEIIPTINGLKNGQVDAYQIDNETWTQLRNTFSAFLVDVFGLIPENEEGMGNHIGENQFDTIMKVLINLRNEARANKNFALSDQIRDQLAEENIILKDGPNGTEWQVKN